MVNCTYSDVRLIIDTGLTDANITSLIVLADDEITVRGFDSQTTTTKKRISMIFTAALIALRDAGAKSIGEYSQTLLSAKDWQAVKAQLITDLTGATGSTGGQVLGDLPFLTVNEPIEGCDDD
jgi:hypothetical protein